MINQPKKMQQLVVISAVGTDKTGVVNDLTKLILDSGGNLEESRMTALGSEFAMLMLVSGNWHALNKLEGALEKMARGSDLTLSVRKTEERAGTEDCMPYLVDVVSLDQPGIVYNLAHFFTSRDIEISEVATRRYGRQPHGRCHVFPADDRESARPRAYLPDSGRFSRGLRPAQPRCHPGAGETVIFNTALLGTRALDSWIFKTSILKPLAQPTLPAAGTDAAQTPDPHYERRELS